MTDDAPRPSGPSDLVPDWDTLGRFVAGEGSVDEMSQVSKWLDANPAERALLERLSEVTAAAPAAGVDVEAALARVHARMEERGPAVALSPASARAKRRWQPLAFVSLLAAAAIVALRCAPRPPGRRPGR